MPDFWEYPTVSMGLGPIMSIYQARFMRHLEDRGLMPAGQRKVWAFLGDGETDEPESLGAITLASREKLDNLIFVINCNLQRLDGPVRGNGQIIQELEAAFRGAGWNVIKCIWGSDWDPLFERDTEGLLARRLGEIVDGQYQKYSVESGAYIREHLFGTRSAAARAGEAPQRRRAAASCGSAATIRSRSMRRTSAAVEHKGQPTVILARTVKGYGLGEAGEGKNITHQQKKLNEDELKAFRERFAIEISDEQVHKSPFFRPADDAPEMQYLHSRRKALGGYVPSRKPTTREGRRRTSSRSSRSSTAAPKAARRRRRWSSSRCWRRCSAIRTSASWSCRSCRTRRGRSAWRRCSAQVGIYSHAGQLYEPVDSDTLLYYKEARDGQIFEEGITEAGSMSTFIAAGTAYATHGINTIPFFIYYSMFGFQRIGDLIWAAGDARCRGFLLGGTAGRTTLAGEGLQHQDGNWHVLSLPVPNCVSYDPAFAYEMAVIIQDGIRRMYGNGESIFYYLTVMNEPVEMPAMPDGRARGHPQGDVQAQGDVKPKAKLRAQLFGSGSILPEVIKAQADPRREVRRRRRRLERHELRRALSRRPRGGAVEHAAPGRDAEGAVRDAVPGRRAGRVRRGLGLPQGAARRDRSLAAAKARVARHRRVRPQRSARRSAQSLRSGRPLHRRRDAVGAHARRQAGREGRAEGDRRSRDQRREGESGYCVVGA